MKIVFGTGTRSLQVADGKEKYRALDLVKEYLQALIDAGEDVVVISGMAEGFDTCVAVAAIELDLHWRAYIPNRGYGRYYWGEHSLTGKNRFEVFNGIVAQADEIIYTDEALGVPGSLYKNRLHMNFHRNHMMVDDGDEGLAWDVTSRGTAECVAYAKRVAVPIHVLGP